MQKIATDIYTFSELRKRGFTYVDKTAILYEMACGDWGKQFFIARPRRFGKSLAISTFQSLFEGRHDLFGGLAIDSLGWDWDATYPVLRLDMGSAQCDTVPELHRRWRDMLRDEASRNGIAFRDDETPAGVYVVEFKLDRPAEEALALIRGKGYADKYALSGKPVSLIGVSFSSEKRTIVDVKVDALGRA